MQRALKDKTNEKSGNIMNKKECDTDKDSVIQYIKKVEETTKDFNLKYDLSKCIEILEGKENQEFIDLKTALEEVLEEKEVLFREKCELAVEVDYLRAKEKRHKKRRE